MCFSLVTGTNQLQFLYWMTTLRMSLVRYRHMYWRKEVKIKVPIYLTKNAATQTSFTSTNFEKVISSRRGLVRSVSAY